MTVGLDVTRGVDRTHRSAAHRVVVRGELDLSTVGVLREHFRQTRRDGAVLVLVDASEVTFIDCAGLRCLNAAQQEFEQVGGQLVIERTSRAVDWLLEMTGLGERFRAPSRVPSNGNVGSDDEEAGTPGSVGDRG